MKTAQKSSVTKEISNTIPEDEECADKNKHTDKYSNSSKIPNKLEATNNNKICHSPTKGRPAFTPSSPSKYIKSTAIADKAAIFEVSSPNKANKDPALLSVSERKALFEKNKGEVLIPKAPFGMAPPVKVESVMKASSTKIINDGKNKFNKPIEKAIVSKATQDIKDKIDPVISEKSVPNKVDAVKPVIHAVVPKNVPQEASEGDCQTTAVVHQSGGIASRVAALMQNKSTISEAQIESSMKSQRQKEIDMLLNRFQRNKEVCLLSSRNK